MKLNMGNIDRIFRILIAALIVILYLTNQLSSSSAIILLVVSVIFIVTGTVGYCPLYHIFGLSSKPKKKS